MDVSETKEAQRRSFLVYVPLLLFGFLVILFLFRLFAGDASRLPSALIGKQVPEFALQPIAGLSDKPGLSSADLRAGRVTILNIFASWCVPCHQEHDTILRLSKDAKLASLGVRIAGIAYKDEPANIRRFLGEDGDPYALVGDDRSGRAAIDLGVYGVPETFVIKGDGKIVYRFVGPMSEEAYRDTIFPEIEKALR
ncbi:DsbE family thiol:disulfide interchange protein [Methylocapsa palsarum]|nr:DsbE family thiol:disulfide interchange protein [Methylocapsa palsarum]